jgi:hypothetical protein
VENLNTFESNDIISFEAIKGTMASLKIEGF